MTAAIHTTDLTKRYGDLTAVDALNLDVAEGELFALLGTNGAGKTTTIKMLSCLIRPTSGEASILGNDLRTGEQAIKQATNISPQETAVAPNLTVMENLELIAEVYGAAGAAAKARARDMVEQFGLQDVVKKRAKTLSGGMQRRLSIAMGLISDPKLLFLDEPTLGLDVLARRELWHAIKALKGKVTLILTTHYMEEVEALADRIGVMSRGRLLAIGTTAELQALTSTESLEDAFVTLAGGAQ